MKNKYKLSIILSGILLSMLMSSTISAVAQKPGLSIITAYYTNLDGDNIEDDVYTEASLILKGEKYTRILLLFELVLPSGYVFRDHYLYCAVTAGEIFKFSFINGAPENGDYIFNLDAYIFRLGEFDYYSDSLLFDPPGEEEPDTPISVSVSP
ncbi:hypothetical protein ES705_15080 [subsurface metagenome]